MEDYMFITNDKIYLVGITMKSNCCVQEGQTIWLVSGFKKNEDPST